MIGINFFNKRGADLPRAPHTPGTPMPQAAEAFIQSLEQRFPGFSLEIFKPYPQYPVHATCRQNNLVLLEGYVHGMRIPSALDQLMNWLERPAVNASHIQDHIRQWSGDFFIVIIRGTECWFFSDFFGRLSVYWHISDGLLYVGRSMQELFKVYPRRADKMGVAQAAWCGFPIAANTFYQGVKRLKGNNVLMYNIATHLFEHIKGEYVNYDDQQEQDIHQAISELADLHMEGCRKIAMATDPFPINISLSGGQDSRLVAWAFSKTPAKVIATSYQAPDAVKDVEIAKILAGICHIPLTVFDLRPNAHAEELLLRVKQGMNYVGMTFIIDFFEQLQAFLPNGSIYLTGDGADNSLRHIAETNHQISMDDLVENMIRRYMIIPPGNVAKMTGISPDELKQSIYNLLKSYPEEIPDNKGAHFYVMERGPQYNFEGEDRNKFFFWGTSPFFDLDFFHRARIIPQSYKSNYKLYMLLSRQLHYPLSEIPDASGGSVNSWRYRGKKFVQEQFRSAGPGLKNFLHALYARQFQKDRTHIRSLQQGLDNLVDTEPNLAWMNGNEVKKLFNNASEKQTEFLRNILKALTLKP